MGEARLRPSAPAGLWLAQDGANAMLKEQTLQRDETSEGPRRPGALHVMLNALLAAWMEHLMWRALVSVDKVSDRRLAEFGIAPRHVRAITRELTADLIADMLGDARATKTPRPLSSKTEAGAKAVAPQLTKKTASYAFCENIR